MPIGSFSWRRTLQVNPETTAVIASADTFLLSNSSETGCNITDRKDIILYLLLFP
jgi:hypothetical protein